MADETITYEIVVDDSGATEAAENVSKSLGKVEDSADKAKKATMSFSDGLNKLVPGLGSAVSGFGAMTKSALAFIATPIGAVIGALGVAIFALTKYFQGSEEGQNRLNKIMLVGSTIMEKVMDVVEDVGEAIYNAFTNPKQAMIDLIDFIKNNLINRFNALGVIMEGIVNLDFKKVANGVLQLGSGIVDVIGKAEKLIENVTATYNVAIAQASRLAELHERLTKSERQLLVDQATTAAQVAKLREESLSQEGEQKEKTVKRIIELENQISAKGLERLKMLLEQAKLERDTNGATEEALLKVAQAQAAVINAETERLNATRRFQKELEAIKNEEAEADKKRREESADEYRRIEDMMEKDAKERADREAKAKEKRDKEAADKEKKVEEIKGAAIQGVIAKTLGTRVDAQKLYTTLFKKGALSETIANTKAAATGAYKALAGIPIIGPILGLAAALAAIAFGTEQATGIQAIQFSRGGLLRGRRHSEGGIPFTVGGQGGFEAEGGEAIINRKSTAMFRSQLSAINAAGGGVRFETGGVIPFATTSIQNQINQEQIFTRMIDVMQATSQKVLVLEEFESVRDSRDETVNRATI